MEPNLIAAVQIITALANAAAGTISNIAELGEKIQTAQDEGRDLTDDELDAFREASQAAVDKFNDLGPAA